MSSSLNHILLLVLTHSRASLEALREWFLPRLNPFWAQTMRVEVRRGFGFRAAMGVGTLFSFALPIALEWERSFA